MALLERLSGQVVSELTRAEIPLSERARIISKNSMLVNVNAEPLFPFRSRKAVAWNTTAEQGWITVKRIGEALYVNGHKVKLWLSEAQANKSIIGGQQLRKKIAQKQGVHPNIMDALIGLAPQMIPDEYKTNKQGRVQYPCSWDVGYMRPDGSEFIRSWNARDGAWAPSYFDMSLDDNFDVRFPALILGKKG